MAITQAKAKRPIDEIIVHCTATPEGRDVSVQTIREWHKGNGWSDIGYHWVVLLDGTVAAGRPEALIGAHVAGHNTNTLGVVYVGGVDSKGKPKDTRTSAQKKALLAHVKTLIERYPTIKKVSGHNQYANKACPSFDVRKDDLGKLFVKPVAAPKAVMPAATWNPPAPAQEPPPRKIAPAPLPPAQPEPPPSWWQRVMNQLFSKEP